MKAGQIVAVILGSVLLVGCMLGGSVSGYYNSVQDKDQAAQTQWGKVESKLQARHDMFQNLANSVRGSMDQEDDVFGAIADARTQYSGAQSANDLNERVEASNQYESALGRLLIVMENYPELRSNERVRDLMTEITGTERRISVERDRYNDAVRDYNRLVVRFPGNILASIFGFEERLYFKSVVGAEKAPIINLED